MKRFDLGDVLSITAGPLVSTRGMDGIYDILNYMTGENLFTHQLPRAANTAKPFLLAQFPQLADIDMDDYGRRYEACGGDKSRVEQFVAEWLSEQKAKYGESLEVKPLPAGENGPRNPIQELEEMVGKDRVLVVQPKAD